MRRATITQRDYISASQLFHWATREHYQIWFTGSTARHKRTEAMLPRLVAKGKLVMVHYGKRLVYTVPRRVRNEGEYRKVEHGLGVTEGLVRLWRARNDCFVISERYFYGCGAVSEFGLLFPNKKFLLYEHCSKDNFDHTTRMVGKLRAYEKYLTTILRTYPKIAMSARILAQAK